MKECLLVIDVQKGFINASNEYILPLIENLLQNYHEGPIIATKYINNDALLEKWSKYHAVKAENETAYAFNITKYTNLIWEKNTYSALTVELKEYLQKEQIQTVYLVGLSTDCCILKTALDLFEAKIRPVVVSKYCAASHPEYHLEGLKLLKRLIGDAQVIEDIERKR